MNAKRKSSTIFFSWAIIIALVNSMNRTTAQTAAGSEFYRDIKLRLYEVCIGLVVLGVIFRFVEYRKKNSPEVNAKLNKVKPIGRQGRK